jgi:apolipoprotein D and lipocalin family protein
LSNLRNRLSIAGAVIALGLASAGSALAAQAPEPSKPVDAARFYTGTWIEIGRHPMSLTNGCVAGATTYTMTGGDKVDVHDTCHQDTPAGKEKSIGGPGTILDPGTNAKLHVSYRLFGFVPVGRDFWVLDHADDYSWFISSDPSFENLWIYTRNPDISPEMRKTLTERAQALGYDVTKLEFPAQP